MMLYNKRHIVFPIAYITDLYGIGIYVRASPSN